MDQEAHPYEQLSSPPPSRPRRVPRVAVVAGLTAFLGLGGAGLAFASGGGGTPAASLSASATTSTSTTVPGRSGAHRMVPFGHLGKPMFGGRFGKGLLHAEYTYQGANGVTTVDVQVGQVTSVSGSSITVKSADGYTQTYAVETATIVDSQANGISAVAAKDQVRVQGLLQGSKRTATDIVDVTKVGNSSQKFGLEQPHGPGMMPPGTPNPPAGTAAA